MLCESVSPCTPSHEVLLLAVTLPTLLGPPLALHYQHPLVLRQTIPQVQPPREADGEGTVHSAQWWVIANQKI